MDTKELNLYFSSLKNLASSSDLVKKSFNQNDNFEKYLQEINSNFNDLSNALDKDIEKFRRDLTQLGAAGFVSYLNQSKIEEKIADKKEELIKILGLDEEGIKTKNESEILELKAILEDLLAQFKRELLSSLHNNSLLEKQQKLASQNPSPLSSILEIL